MQAEEAFNLLKEKFTTASVLVLTEPQLQFLVEVDASDLGLGAVNKFLKKGSGSCSFPVSGE